MSIISCADKNFGLKCTNRKTFHTEINMQMSNVVRCERNLPLSFCCFFFFFGNVAFNMDCNLRGDYFVDTERETRQTPNAIH